MNPSHSSVPFLFARFREPGEIPVAVGKLIEAKLRRPSTAGYSALDWAHEIQGALDPYSASYAAMETALMFACQIAMMRGATAEEMEAVRAKMNEGPIPIDLTPFGVDKMKAS